MKSVYIKDHSINYTETDKTAKLGLCGAVSLIQDMTTEYFEVLGSNNTKMKNEYNALWVLSKTKIHFYRFPVWMEYIKEKTYTVVRKPVRIGTEILFIDKNNDILFEAKQESCVIDYTTRKLRKLESVGYPLQSEIEEEIIKEPYLKLQEQFSDEDKIGTQKVIYTHIDYSNHTNNVAYIKYILNALGSEVLDNILVTDFEIHYINESREGQCLDIYKKDKENEMEFLIKEQDREIVRASIKYKKVSI